MVTRAGPLDAFLNQRGKIEIDLLGFARTRFSSLKHLIDSFHQAVGIFEHQSIEIAPLWFLDFPALQSLQIEPNGCNWRLELMRDRIYEAVMLLIPTDFADQEAGVQIKSLDYCAKKYNSQEGLQFFLPVGDSPAKAYRDRSCRQQDAE